MRITRVLLILGTERKEFILFALVLICGSPNLLQFLSPVHLVTLALIVMIYIPCISTIAILAKEFDWKTVIIVTVANIAATHLIGGPAYRILTVIL